jgi:hypothetical protein
MITLDLSFVFGYYEICEKRSIAANGGNRWCKKEKTKTAALHKTLVNINEIQALANGGSARENRKSMILQPNNRWPRRCVAQSERNNKLSPYDR